MTTAVQPLTAAANDPGDSFHTRASSDEFLAYSCIIRLQHSGAANGTLIGTFEHAAKDGTVRDQAGTASWRHLTVTGSG
ncbi:hypothetical protein SSPO_099150 [Streptomyces antimycoticus]|uniref:Uncharacterized protein n=1 Tax=Streptomyces antimycoticus TaxID=68175 RepID=A0A499VLX1_9ACTN|nr:hypothetical protein SSPO_099150 [Streptomyces antimycoticus]